MMSRKQLAVSRENLIPIILLIFGMAVFLGKPPVGAGETWRGEELKRQVKEAWLKFGPFRINTVLFLSNAGYDTNVYHSPDNPVKDYWLTIGPGFTFYLPLKKRIIFTIYESPQYVYFMETKRERTWNNYFNGQVNFIFNKFFLTAGIGDSDARERWNTEIDIRPRRKEDRVHGSVLWQASRRTSFSLGYRKIKYDYENLFYERFNLKDRLNREETYMNFTGFYQLSFRMRFFLDAEYGIFNFENPSSFRDSKSYSVYGGFEFSPFGRIRGRVKLGYKFFDSLALERKDYSGIVGDTNVSVRLSRYLNFRAAYRRDVQFSLWYNNTYFLESGYGGGASVYLLKNIRLDYDYSLGRNTYPEEQFLSGENLYFNKKRQDEYKVHSVGIYFRLKKDIGVGVTASRWMRESNIYMNDSRRDFVGLNLTYNF